MLFLTRQKRIIQKLSKDLHSTACRAGYIVLVPEIGEGPNAIEGMLRSNGLPAFNDITIEHCLGAISQQASLVEKRVKEIETGMNENDGKSDLNKLFHDLDEVTGPLETTWGIAKTLYLGNSSLIPTKSYMNIHERARSARGCKFTNKTIYNTLKSQQFLDNQPDMSIKRLLKKYMLEGKLNGLELSEDQRNSLKEVLLQLGKERGNFKNKVAMAIHTFRHVITDYNVMRDFPLTFLEATAKDPNCPMQGPWNITLYPQIYNCFIKYCPDRMLRWNLWQANVRKASIQLEKSLETSTHLEKIRALRKRQANILGYPTYAHMSMETKMIGNVDKIKELLAKLLQFSSPVQLLEIEKLQNYAIDAGFKYKLDVFDVPFWGRKYLFNEYGLNEETLREYFPLPKVMTGLLALAEKLFNIKIVERSDVEVWQPAVKYFDIYDCDNCSAVTPVGGFYLDWYSNENKYGKNNGWMVSIRNRNQATSSKPLCALVFNFTPPASGKPYLLSIEDMRIVFKTFGSAMQHLLTKSNYSDLAGLSNIEWDASQVTGQVMANFLDNPDTLREISCHVSSEDKLSEEMATKVKYFKTNLAGYHLCQELYLAHLDLELHQSDDFWLDVVKKLWPVYHLMPLDKKDSHPCSMTDIFSGDWAAAYYSNLYSKVIAADISEAFNQRAEMKETGKRFKDTFLSVGGSAPAVEVFRRFRGRDPSCESLLKSLQIYKHSDKQTSDNL